MGNYLKTSDHSISSYNQNQNYLYYSDYYKTLKCRVPYLLEEYLGLNMTYNICYFTPNNLGKTKLRNAVKENMLDDLKAMVFTGEQKIDDPIDVYTCHTMLHEAVILNRQELFQFLLTQGANLNVRDQNGYTPLLKAASIGRVDMCR